MHIHFLVHAEFEDPGYFALWAEHNAVSYTISKTFTGEDLPAPCDFDLLVIMGGPQDLQLLEHYPYLLDEIVLIQRAIDENKSVIGVCLGAQLIAESYGAKTLKSPYKEIGMHPISLTEEAAQDPIFNQLPETFDVCHWHESMPGLPGDAKILAKSAGSPRQIIRFANKVYGLQCHMELNQSSLSALIDACPDDLIEGQFVASAKTMRDCDFAIMHKLLCENARAIDCAKLPLHRMSTYSQ